MNKLIRTYVSRISHKNTMLSHIFHRRRNNIIGDLERSVGGDWLGSEISSENVRIFVIYRITVYYGSTLLTNSNTDYVFQLPPFPHPRNIRVVKYLCSFPKPILQEIMNCFRNIRDKFGEN